MKLIGFSGGMGVGKSTAIQCLRELQSYAVFNVKFAKPLYDIQEYIYGRIHKVHNRGLDFKKDRKLLQWLGTDWGREISGSLWVDLWQEAVKSYAEPYVGVRHWPLIVCDDVRFDNEAEAIRALGGKVILLTSDRTGERDVVRNGIDKHKSEAGIDLSLVDAIIENNGSIQDLKDSLSEFNKLEGVW